MLGSHVGIGRHVAQHWPTQRGGRLEILDMAAVQRIEGAPHSFTEGALDDDAALLVLTRSSEPAPVHPLTPLSMAADG